MTPTAQELEAAARWVEQRFSPAARASDLPFSFTCGSGPSSDLFAKSKPVRKTRRLDAARTLRSLTWTDAATGVQVRLEATAYRDYPAVEWVLHLANRGTRDTPILADVHAADFRVARDRSGKFTIYHADGSHEQITDFRAHETALSPGATLRFAPDGGRSSDGVMPFFNVMRDNGGMMLAIGWTGQWAAVFTREGADLTIQAGMELTHLRLHPGEEIRTPAILLLFYSGDRLRGHNLLRSLLLRHYSRRPGGRAVDPPVATSGATIGFNNVSEANQVQAIANVAAHTLPVNCWWVDAGWSTGGFPLGMGTWDPDPTRFPRGLKPVAEAAHKAGFKFLVWFEPERVMPGTWLREKHPEWLLAPANLPPPLAYQSDWRLLDLGNGAALAWAKRTFSAMIGEVGVDIYRHDFNLHPLYYWRANESPDRQGMNEIRYISGLYDYLDTLAREHPHLLLDNSASGGRRLDFEMLRRCVPLLRTDYLWDPVGAQSMEYALSFWLALHGQGAVSTDPYDFRSGMGTHMAYAFDFYSPDAPFWAPLAQRIAEYERVRPLFSGDFFPLTPYSTANDVWIAWQFDRPDLGQGLVQAFRRAACASDSLGVRLEGLDPAARYAVANPDESGSCEFSGRELMTDGLTVRLPAHPGSAILIYRKVVAIRP